MNIERGNSDLRQLLEDLLTVPPVVLGASTNEAEALVADFIRTGFDEIENASGGDEVSAGTIIVLRHNA